MKTLNQEAEEYVKRLFQDRLDNLTTCGLKNAYIDCGNNSQYVKNQIIQGKIDVLNEQLNWLLNSETVYPMSMKSKETPGQHLQNKIKELKKQLDK